MRALSTPRPTGKLRRATNYYHGQCPKSPEGPNTIAIGLVARSIKVQLTVASPGTFKPVPILCAISSPGIIGNELLFIIYEFPTWLRKPILGPEERQDQRLFPEPSHHLQYINTEY